LVVAGTCIVASGTLLRVPLLAAPGERVLTFFNTHTEERLTAVYFSAGAHDPAVLEQLNAVLRDHRSGEIGHMDPALFDLLHEVAQLAGAEPAFDVISGFRSVSSNEMLRARGGGVSQTSLHLQGKAIDVRLRGVECAQLRDLARGLKRGGVGFYPKSDFVHLDTGRVRSWGG
jgi:uncharacterized protein YcbK (DUF882 family)